MQGLKTFGVCQYYPAHVRKDASGCTSFQGEDPDAEDRKKKQAAEQREYLSKQIEEKKQKKAMSRAQDMAFDHQRVAVANAVNRNHDEFGLRNLAVAQQCMDENVELDRLRKEREAAKKAAEKAQDEEELAFTNATELKYTAYSVNEQMLQGTGQQS